MQQWNDQMLSWSAAGEFPGDVLKSKWLGFPPATDALIAAADERLGIPLPPSYREFLKVTNGWRRLNHAIDRVWGTEEIGWFKKEHKDWIGAYTGPTLYGPRDETPDEEYFSYENPMDFRPGHLRETLQISAVGDSAVFLLNPQVIGADGEWEAWFFANWNPGAQRFRSFHELMDAKFHEFLNLPWKQQVGIIGELPREYSGAPGSTKRSLKKRRRRQTVKILNKPLVS